MATSTLGTNATSSLTSLLFSGSQAIADVATIQQLIKGQTSAHNQQPGAWDPTGLVYLPGGQGLIIMKPGDYIAVDPATGWPIVVSAYAIANGAFTHT